jgi:xanthine dehydrogenase accessory factor
MNLKILKSIVDKKKNDTEFGIITNLSTGEVELFIKQKPLSKNLEKYSNEIYNFLENKKIGLIDNSDLFVETFKKPIKVIIVGAVHITQYFIDYAKSLNFEIFIIDPRGYFVSKKKFPEINLINKWPNEALKELETNKDTALIALTHDPKIDDPAIQHALRKKFYYIGALGSKKTHEDRCKRLREAGFNREQVNTIHGPIGIKLGGKSAPEIALSIIAQLVSETYKK